MDQTIQEMTQFEVSQHVKRIFENDHEMKILGILFRNDHDATLGSCALMPCLTRAQCLELGLSRSGNASFIWAHYLALKEKMKCQTATDETPMK